MGSKYLEANATKPDPKELPEFLEGFTPPELTPMLKQELTTPKK